MDKVAQVDVDDFTPEEVSKLIEQLDSGGDLEETDRYVMKELFRSDKSNIKFKTDLNHDQIKAIVKLLTADRIMKVQSITDKETAAKEMDSVVWDLTNNLMQLMVSVQRKGRGEFIDAWKGGEAQKKQEGWMKWLGGGQ